jgi:hypothetical protein
MFDSLPQQKINKKRLESLNRLKKKKELKISKSKQKKSAQIAARKIVKETVFLKLIVTYNYLILEGITFWKTSTLSVG